jgi:hypothetical protein
MTTEDFLAELAVSLRGPRRHRKRLIDEIAAHIDDAIRAELAITVPRVEAERIVLHRLGCADRIARHWNSDRRIARGRRRRRLAAIALAVVVAGALGLTQYAAGKPQLPRRDPPARTTPERIPGSSRLSRHIRAKQLLTPAVQCGSLRTPRISVFPAQLCFSRWSVPGSNR